MTSDYVTAGRTPDGNLVMAYLPSLRTVTVDMSQLSAAATARWYDPSRGTYTTVEGSPLANTGISLRRPSTTVSIGRWFTWSTARLGLP